MHTSGLNDRYSFETFIVGPSNQFAHAACRAVAEAPSHSYNPLFIYGGVGLGKTHLMHAIGQYVLQHDPSLKLTYISSERFMNEMINALRYERILDFRERYRTVDILLVRRHPVRFGQGGHADRVLPHVQRALRRQEADRPQQRPAAARDSRARRTPSIEVRMGTDRRYPTPDLETKMAILKRKAEAEGIPLPDDVAMFIAGGSSRTSANWRVP
jgi:chromosomal replication initiator protein